MKLTQHAKQRRKQMKITEHQIEDALRNPDMTYPTDRCGHKRTAYQRGRIVVIYQDDTNEVVTILWHRLESREDYSP